MLEVSGKNIKAAITTVPNEEKKIKVEMHTKIGNLNGEVNIYMLYMLCYLLICFIYTSAIYVLATYIYICI